MKSDNTDISNIRKQFQSTFDDFKLPPPTDGWAQLEASLDVAKMAKPTLRRRLYIASMAAAAVLLLLIGTTLLLHYINPVASEIETAVVPDITPEVTPDIIHIDNYYADVQEETVAPHSEPLIAEANNRQQAPQQPAAIIDESQPEQIEPVIETPTDTPTTIPTFRNRRNNDANQIQLSDDFILIAANRNETVADLPTQRRRRDNLSVAFGSRSGVAPFYAQVNTPMTLRAAVSEEEESSYIIRNEESVINNVSEKEHSPPMSFGVTVSIPIADRLSLETGLVYTFLSSRVSNTSLSVNEQERQRLHYLGIPLNLNYTLFNINDINVFTTAGGMVEKNIFGTYRRRRTVEVPDETNIANLPSSHEMETIRIRQRNPQFSVNMGVGASYPIANQWRLYGRIGGTYYFNARNRHRTIYHDARIVMNLNIGIRYEF